MANSFWFWLDWESNAPFIVGSFLFFCLWLVWVHQIRQCRDKEKSRKKEYDESYPDIAPRYPYPDEEQHRASEQAYWVRRIVAQNRTPWLGRFTLIAAAVAAGAGFFSYQQTRRQANIAQADQRPWVGAPVIISDTCKEDGTLHPTQTGRFGFVMKFRNVGRTPANNLFVVANVGTESRALSIVGDYCTRALKVFQNPEVANNSIVPSDSYVGHLFVAEPGEMKDFSVISRADVPEQSEKPSIFGCTVYYSTADRQPHKSIFLAALLIHENALDGTAMCVNDSYSISPD